MTRRHLLVIATQCRAKDPLEHLEEAAAALYGVLADEAAGECQPGLRDEDSLLCGTLTSREIEARVREAIEYADEENATLILALLGHGFSPGDATTLYFMGYDAVGDRLSGVEVGTLLRDAADAPGISGVIGIVDTCYAGSAPPRLDELARGLRGGRVQLTLLMASSAAEQAFGLRFSRELADVLRHGLPDAGPLLRAGDVKEELQRRVRGQTVSKLEYDADLSAAPALWLARNVKHDDGQLEDLIGVKGRQGLRAAWRALGLAAPSPGEPWNSRTLRALQRELAEHDESDQRGQARRAVTNARIALEAVKFLRSRIGQQLSTARLRRALAALWAEEGWQSPAPPRLTDVEAVDHVAFGHPDPHRDCREWMSKFVWLMVSEAGVADTDAGLWRWAEAVDARQQVRDAIESVREMREREHLRLVIWLPSLAGDWPQSLEAWLYQDEKQCGRESFPCEPVGRLGTERALNEVLGWAHEAAEDLKDAGDAGSGLSRVDIAIPSALLLAWQPEEVEVGPGHEYLGVTHDVFTHWSQRLSPPKTQWWIRKAADERLSRINECKSGVPLDWIAEPRSREHSTLQEDLKRGKYMRAVGLEQHPGTDIALMDLLLRYIPIVLWPQTEAGFPAERQACLDLHWGNLPRGFLTAYRKHWRREPAGDLADLRAVWDDQEWLGFCRKFTRPLVS
jgi:hypothetical protein